MPKKSSAGAILYGKCPKCRQGDIFKYPAWHITSFSKMHSHCPVCGTQYEREPGFFFGAMYISYAFSVAIFIAVGLFLSFFGDFRLEVYLLVVVGVVVLLLPPVFRYSRILFLHLFGGIDFDPKFSN